MAARPIAVLCLVAALAIGAGAFAISRGSTASRITFAPVHLAAGSPIDKPLGRLPLIAEDGKATSLRAFAGKWVVLAPSLTLCHEVCPLTTGALERVQAQMTSLGLGGRVVVAEASVDPWRDSPARIRAFKRLTETDIRFLTGTKPEVHDLWKELGVYYRRVAQGKPPDVDWWTHRAETFDVQHSDGVYLIDPRGHLRVAIAGMPDVSGLSTRLTALLNDEGRGNLRHPDDPWTVDQIVGDLWQLTGHRGSVPAPKASGTPAAAAAPAPKALAALRTVGGKLVGGPAAFTAQLHRLRGHPVIVNEWASWCAPCRLEAPLLAAAAQRFGDHVAFVGLNVNDAAPAARTFLAKYPADYPSFSDPQAKTATALGQFAGLPTTLYLDARGKVTFIHSGGYPDARTLDGDVEAHAVG